MIPEAAYGPEAMPKILPITSLKKFIYRLYIRKSGDLIGSNGCLLPLPIKLPISLKTFAMGPWAKSLAKHRREDADEILLNNLAKPFPFAFPLLLLPVALPPYSVFLAFFFFLLPPSASFLLSYFFTTARATMSSEAPTAAKGIFMALKGTPAISFHSSRTDMQWLIYRKSFIGLSITFTILSLLITAVDLGKKKESYLETVQQLPPGVAEHADGLAMFMYYNDIILFCVALLSFAVSIEGYKRVEGNTSSSCFLVRFAWICNTAMPFLTLMIVAGRSQVDWDGAVEGLCNNTFANVMGSNGRYPGMFDLIQSIEASPLVAVDPAFSEATAEVAIPKFCGKHSWDWSVEFFGPLPTGSSSNQPPALEDIASICGAGQEEIFQNLADPDYPVARKVRRGDAEVECPSEATTQKYI
jgi:hypothetical protein